MDKTPMQPGQELNSSLFEFIIERDLSISLVIEGWMFLVVLVLIGIFLIIKFKHINLLNTLEIDEAEFGIGNQKFKLKPNNIDSQIAYKIWVELSTRKIGIEVNLDKDVIVEVYNSWYEFFGVTRELIKEIPAPKLRRKGTKQIIKLSINILNFGIRPHLTEWQARFRRWYEKELFKKENELLSPQEIQKNFTSYDELAYDIVEVNKKLIKYRKAMYVLATGKFD